MPKIGKEYIFFYVLYKRFCAKNQINYLIKKRVKTKRNWFHLLILTNKEKLVASCKLEERSESSWWRKLS